jgi:hypothetical protein
MKKQIKDSILLDIAFLLCQIVFMVGFCTGVMYLMYGILCFAKQLFR